MLNRFGLNQALEGVLDELKEMLQKRVSKMVDDILLGEITFNRRLSRLMSKISGEQYVCAVKVDGASYIYITDSLYPADVQRLIEFTFDRTFDEMGWKYLSPRDVTIIRTIPAGVNPQVIVRENNNGQQRLTGT